MKRVAVLAMAVATVCIPLRGQPEPSEFPSSWQLDFRYPELPQAIEVRVPGQSEPQLFWYLRYTVTNHTGEDQVFVPDFTLYTDTGQLIEAGKGVHWTVFEAIKSVHNDVFLRDTTEMAGKLLQGEDNAKTGVAIWPDFDPKAGGFDIFIGGLSGEAAQIALPKPVEVNEIDVTTGQRRTVTKTQLVLSKTLRMRFGIVGDAEARATTPVELIQKDWVMR